MSNISASGISWTKSGNYNYEKYNTNEYFLTPNNINEIISVINSHANDIITLNNEKGTVKSVNNKKPDTAGNVNISVEVAAVKSINNLSGIVTLQQNTNNITAVGNKLNFYDVTSLNNSYGNMFITINNKSITAINNKINITAVESVNQKAGNILLRQNGIDIIPTESAGTSIFNITTTAGNITSINDAIGKIRIKQNNSTISVTSESGYNCINLNTVSSVNDKIGKIRIKQNGTVITPTQSGEYNEFNIISEAIDAKYIVDVPIGTIMYWTGIEGNIPAGWHICDGTAIPTNDGHDYTDLKNILKSSAEFSKNPDNFPNLTDSKFIKCTKLTGKIEAAGLPNIAGYAQQFQSKEYIYSNTNYTSGAFTATNKKYAPPQINWSTMIGNFASHSSTNTADTILQLDAHRFNSIYGNSTTVTPYNISLIPIIKSYRTINQSSQFVQSINNCFGEFTFKQKGNIVQATKTAENKYELNFTDETEQPKITTYITDTWHDNAGNWYRKYSDGWIEQGGVATFNVEKKGYDSSGTVTLKLQFSNTNYHLIGTIKNTRGGAGTISLYPKNTSIFVWFYDHSGGDSISTGNGTFYWEAKGY